jgi:prepilin-type N-terminal cleavage/methylation domain-containing protein
MSNRSRMTPATARDLGGNRSGMTLIEVIVSMVLLSGALLAMGAFTARYANVTGSMSRRSEANELVADRLEEVKGALKYAAIDSVFAKTEATIPNHPGYARQTLVTRTGGQPADLYDYKTVTVIVTGAGLTKPSKKSTVISVF